VEGEKKLITDHKVFLLRAPSTSTVIQKEARQIG